MCSAALFSARYSPIYAPVLYSDTPFSVLHVSIAASALCGAALFPALHSAVSAPVFHAVRKYMAADTLAKPATNAARAGRNLYRSQVAKAKAQKIKKKKSGSRINRHDCKKRKQEQPHIPHDILCHHGKAH